ncbi:MAG: glycosyltransferase, partial [Bacteroidales bacterium]
YMAMEIPTVMSAVGVNKEIISEGVNGFLASSEDEWITKLSLLIESEELRKKIGIEGRKTVIEKYSVDSQKQRYLEYFNELLKK